MTQTFLLPIKIWKPNRLEHDSYLAIEWFEGNYMKLNQDKCHFLVSGYMWENIWARIGKVKIWESSKQKLLGVVTDRELKKKCVTLWILILSTNLFQNRLLIK